MVLEYAQPVKKNFFVVSLSRTGVARGPRNSTFSKLQIPDKPQKVAVMGLKSGYFVELPPNMVEFQVFCSKRFDRTRTYLASKFYPPQCRPIEL